MPGRPPRYDVTARPRRQDLTSATLRYRETGSLYLTRTWVYDELDNRLGGRVGLFVMDELEGIDVDTELDLEVADRRLTRSSPGAPHDHRPDHPAPRRLRRGPGADGTGEDHRQQGAHRLLRHRARPPRRVDQRRRRAPLDRGAGRRRPAPPVRRGRQHRGAQRPGDGHPRRDPPAVRRRHRPRAAARRARPPRRRRRQPQRRLPGRPPRRRPRPPGLPHRRDRHQPQRRRRRWPRSSSTSPRAPAPTA